MSPCPHRSPAQSDLPYQPCPHPLSPPHYRLLQRLDLPSSSSDRRSLHSLPCSDPQSAPDCPRPRCCRLLPSRSVRRPCLMSLRHCRSTPTRLCPSPSRQS